MIGYSSVGFNLVEVSPHFTLVLNHAYKEITNELGKLQEQFEILVEQLQFQEAQRTDDLMNSARKGIHHLLDGMNSKKKKVQNTSFALAYNEFTKLVSFDNSSPIERTQETIGRANYICVGYWGNFHYFTLIDDKQSAAIQVYECALRYPRQAVSIFPTSFFKHDFHKLIEGLEKEISHLRYRFGEFQRLESTMMELERYMQSVGAIAYGSIEHEYSFIGEETSAISGSIRKIEEQLADYLHVVTESSQQCLSDLKKKSFDTLVEK